jgi:riboflavin kinase/FMN adenylyltransferase
MKIITNIEQAPEIKGEIDAALGYFDGMHLGHQKILAATAASGMKRAVITFSNSPAAYCSPGIDVKRLMSLDDKVAYMKNAGIDYLFMYPFDDYIKNMSKEEFVDRFIFGLHVKHVVVGFNYTFGKGKSGTKHDLKKLCAPYGIGVEVVSSVRCRGEIISSTAIRRYLQNGDIRRANAMLGAPYTLNGSVISGKQIGRRIGFPTANIQLDAEMLVPKWGVYLTNIMIKGKKYVGLTNIGDNPTLKAGKLSVETYILDFSGNIYDSKIRLEFEDFLREEKKFENTDALRQQIKADIETAKNRAARDMGGRQATGGLSDDR